MGKLEEAARIQRRRGYVQDAVLAAVGIAGVLLVMMAAPNAIQLLGMFGAGKKRFADKTRSALSRLASRGLITFEERGGEKYARITEAGRRELALVQEKSAVRAKVGKRWDKRYRIVIFDIPERNRHIRRALRTAMREAGFLCIQRSVWVFPYDCEDLIALLKANLHVGKDVLYTIVEKIENDAWIRKHFGLPPDIA